MNFNYEKISKVLLYILAALLAIALLIGFSSCSPFSIKQPSSEVEKIVIIGSPMVEHVRGDMFYRYKVKRIKTSTVNYIVLPYEQKYELNDTILYRYN
jgi:hypothetical protein